MTDAVESMAYTNEVPWHGLGEYVTDDMTPDQMLKAASLDWKVAKHPVFLEGGVKIKDKYALLRDTDRSVLSIVGSTYKPVQNDEVLDFFKKFVESGHMKMETAGSLWDGRYIWALARINQDFKVGKNDEVQNYLLLCQPHVHGKAMVFQYTNIRVVCWNTLTFALGSSLSGGASAFRMPHSTKFDESVKDRAEIALGLSQKQATEFKEAAKLLAKKKVKADQIDDFFFQVLRFDPEKAKKKNDGDAREPRALPLYRAALEYAPGADLNTAKGTLWGLVNAVSYVVDHQMGRSRQTALKNAWLGNTANIKRRAFETAIEWAK